LGWAELTHGQRGSDWILEYMVQLLID